MNLPIPMKQGAFVSGVQGYLIFRDWIISVLKDERLRSGIAVVKRLTENNKGAAASGTSSIVINLLDVFHGNLQQGI